MSDSRSTAPSPKISVVMAVYNGQPYLQEALDSIAAQTYADFELIVVDDASTDKSVEILKAQTDARLRLVLLPRNVGLAEALNHGIAEARGEFVARMDADDIAYPGRFSAQVGRLENEQELVLLGTAFDYVDSLGRILKPKLLRTNDTAIRESLFLDGNQFCHPSVMIRRDALLKVGSYRALVGRLAQDYDLWLRLAEVGRLANLPDVYLGYRVHHRQSSVNKLFSQRRAAEIYRLLAKQRREQGIEDLSEAEWAVTEARRDLKNKVAYECLHWSEMFACMGNPVFSLRMQGAALWAAPFNRTVHSVIRSHLLAGLRRWGITSIKLIILFIFVKA